MKTYEDVQAAMHRLQKEISASVTAQDGPKKIMEAVDLLIDVKIDMAIARVITYMEQKQVQKPDRYLELQDDSLKTDYHIAKLSQIGPKDD